MNISRDGETPGCPSPLWNFSTMQLVLVCEILGKFVG